jgi:hypothetical protein
MEIGQKPIQTGPIPPTTHARGTPEQPGYQLYVGMFSGRAGLGQAKKKPEAKNQRPRPGPARLSGQKF